MQSFLSSALCERFAALPAPPLEGQLELARGSLKDYAALAEHHYRANRPATATRVLVLRHVRATAASRFAGLPAPAQTVAVLVESLPALCCRLRDEALGPRYAGLRDWRTRAAVLNDEVRCISRVIVHPSWRSLGLAVRLVRAALETAQTPLTEALAAMGHVHPFFERAGMTAYRRPPHEHDARLAAALASAGFAPVDLALIEQAWARMECLPPAQRDWLLLELRRWHQRTHRSAKSQPRLSDKEMLRAARGRLQCEPVYYLKRHDSRGM